MKRLHLFEFEDFHWFPETFRNGITDFLEFHANFIKVYVPVLSLIKKGIEKSKKDKIIDLCSGGGGGTLSISRHLQEEKIETKIILTDKFPNIKAFKRISALSNGCIEFLENPIDAMEVPANLDGFRTLFVAFHHFKPEDAMKILADAVKKNEPIGIFEYTERNLFTFLFICLTPFGVWLATPFMKSVGFKKLFFTYIIPAIPLFTTLDGLVSVLRTYSVNEMKEMTKKLGATHYEWEIGKAKVKGPLHVLYLIGCPKENN